MDENSWDVNKTSRSCSILAQVLNRASPKIFVKLIYFPDITILEPLSNDAETVIIADQVTFGQSDAWKLYFK